MNSNLSPAPSKPEMVVGMSRALLLVCRHSDFFWARSGELHASTLTSLIREQAGEELLRAVFWKARQLVSKEFEGGFLILNIDQDDPLKPALKKPDLMSRLMSWFRKRLVPPLVKSVDAPQHSCVGKGKKGKKASTFFMHKELSRKGRGKGSSLGLLSPDMFFDPRDI